MIADNITNKITGIILAGGKSIRMQGKNKGLVQINGKPLISYVIQRLNPQAENLIINSNSNISEYKKFGLPVVQDAIPDHPGPLAGIAACMAQAKTEFVLCVPCDAPVLPADLGERLYQSITENHTELAYVHDGIRPQPLFAMIQRDLMTSINDYLGTAQHKVDNWYHQHQYSECDFSDETENFLNINTEQDLQKAAVQCKIQ